MLVLVALLLRREPERIEMNTQKNKLASPLTPKMACIKDKHEQTLTENTTMLHKMLLQTQREKQKTKHATTTTTKRRRIPKKQICIAVNATNGLYKRQTRTIIDRKYHNATQNATANETRKANHENSQPQQPPKESICITVTVEDGSVKRQLETHEL